ncbi:MAG: sigma-70 family RNA polymerase sigma factor [Proteobacteria bacterium]|nr:sigma-70 family RNA polymerase sigma factor [Pseudomonadota bacterium]
MPDDQLMLAYADGDRAAFDVLYGRHEGALYRFVRRLLGVRLSAEADEVFQETWYRIIAARESFSPQGASWRTWAFTIAHNLSMDRLRVTGREVAFYAHDEEGDSAESIRMFRHRLSADGDSELGEAASPSAEEVAFWRAAGRRLLACLGELPHDQRAAFLLHNEEGFTVEAMAQTLNVNFETVRSRLRYGLKKLRTCMDRYLQVMERRA